MTSTTLSIIIQAATATTPNTVRYFLLKTLLGWNISSSAKISRFSIILSKNVSISSGARIAALTVIKKLELLALGENSKIGHLCWISGYPKTGDSFKDSSQRKSSLEIGNESSITHRHVIDCTSQVIIGNFTTLGGYRTTLLTHGINVETNRQETEPVIIGDHSFIGTNCIILKGARIPSQSVVAAGSVVTKTEFPSGNLIGGTPAKVIKPLNINGRYFQRTSGEVH